MTKKFYGFAGGRSLKLGGFLRRGEANDELARAGAHPTNCFRPLRINPVQAHRDTVRANLSPLSCLDTPAEVFNIDLALDHHRSTEGNAIIL